MSSRLNGTLVKEYSGSDEHNGRVFLDYDFKSITCDYPVP